MHISVNRVEIEGFQSINKASLDLKSMGIVLVNGINECEDNATSNGSGKSSIFESIMYAIYGKTSFGITDPHNRYYIGPCIVKLDISVDNTNYMIERAAGNDSYVKLYRIIDGEHKIDITQKNKTDTDKYIRDIISINSDIFLSTIFLAQGFSHRISSLTPSARKDRIETITGISDKIEEFKTRLTSIKSSIERDLVSIEKEVSSKKGSLSSLEDRLRSIRYKLSDIMSRLGDYSVPDDIDKVREEYDTLSQKVSGMTSDKSMIESRMSSIGSDISRCDRDIRAEEKSIEDIMSDISRLSDSICPTCGSVIDKDKTDMLRENMSKSVISHKMRLIDLNNSREELSRDLDSMKPKVEEISRMILEISNSMSSMKPLLSNQTDVNAVSVLKREESEIQSDLESIKSSIEEINSQLELVRCDYDIISNCCKLLTGKFRTYLLESIVSYMNSRLKYYSRMIFSESTGDIMINSSSNKLSILLGESQYETLSGGEKRKIDIALTFAQRDLLIDMSGVSCNIMILDEVMDHMDEVATNSVLNMIQEVSESISSLFIISHNNYSIPSDSVITVTKSNNISTLSVN